MPLRFEERRHDATVRRIRATIQMNSGVPIAVVITPTGIARPAGRQPDDEVREEQQERANRGRRNSARPGWPRVSARAA